MLSITGLGKILIKATVTAMFTQLMLTRLRMGWRQEVPGRLSLNKSSALITLLLLGITSAVFAQQDQRFEAGSYFLDNQGSNKYALIMAGPSASAENAGRFKQWAYSLHDILARDYGYSSATISLLLDKGAGQDPGSERVDGACDRAGIEAQITALQAQLKPGDQLTVFLIGHGSGGEEQSKFNIVGPDITGEEFSQLLDGFDQQNLVVVNGTSASYGFSAALSAPGRIIISSTRSPSEKYDPIFPRFFIEGLDNRAGDRDKNNRLSLLEAFNYATQNVTQWYEEQGRLAAEHAGLDDNGDALFTLSPTVTEIDGRLAEIAYIDNSVANDAGLSAEAIAGLMKIQEIERSVFILRGNKADYLEVDYWQQMETLLVALARTTAASAALN